MKCFKLNAFEVVSRAVEEGIATGYRRAHKHTDKPEEEVLKDALQQEVISALCEVIVFEEGE